MLKVRLILLQLSSDPRRFLQRHLTPTRNSVMESWCKSVSSPHHYRDCIRLAINLPHLTQSVVLERPAPVCCNTLNRDDECHQIEVDQGDPFFEKGHCIELVRSRPYNNSETACLKNNAGKTAPAISSYTFSCRLIIHHRSVSEIRCLSQ